MRKNFDRRTNDDGNDVWSYEEQKIPKEDWQTYTQIIDMNGTVSDLSEAVMELAEIIGG